MIKKEKTNKQKKKKKKKKQYENTRQHHQQGSLLEQNPRTMVLIAIHKNNSDKEYNVKYFFTIN